MRAKRALSSLKSGIEGAVGGRVVRSGADLHNITMSLSSVYRQMGTHVYNGCFVPPNSWGDGTRDASHGALVYQMLLK